MQRFELKRHVCRRLRLGRRAGAPAPDEEIRFNVLLHAKDERALGRAAEAVGDPRAPSRGRFVTPNEIRQLVAPGYQDLDAVIAWLVDAGLTVDGPIGARTVLRARGSAARVALTFDVALGAYELARDLAPQATRFTAIERNPSIPASLASVVRGIAGLNTLPCARRFLPLSSRRGPGAAKSQRSGLTPERVRRLYTLPDDGGSGERVALLQFGGSRRLRDFETFCRAFDLPGGLPGEVSVGPKEEKDQKRGGPGLDVTSDAEWMRALAPSAAIEYWWAPNTDLGWVEFLCALLDAPEDARPSVVVCPWGMPEDGFSSSRRYDQTRLLFQCAALLGMTFVAAAGDRGAAGEDPSSCAFDGERHVAFPGVIPEVTSVGGTRISPDGRRQEAVWNDGRGGASGGGFSRFVRAPAWQRGTWTGNSGSMGRGIPDVAAVAAPEPGLAVRASGRWTVAGGTGLAAIVWGAIFARLNSARRAAGRPPLGPANHALYEAAAAANSPFNDITSGNNSFGGVSGFSACKGWDPVSGLGSPDGEKLLKALG